jgi:hypothetical protein
MVSLASKGLSSLPNELIHRIAQLSDNQFFGRSGDQVRFDPYPVVPYHLSSHASLDFVLEAFDCRHSFIPIPMVGPVRFVFTFKLPTWWPTAEGITKTELYESFSHHSMVRRIDLYMVDLARLTPKQVDSVHRSGLFYELYVTPLSCMYDSLPNLRSTPFKTLYTARGLYVNEGRLTGIPHQNEFYTYTLTDGSLCYYRSKSGLWHCLVSLTLSDLNEHPISTFSIVERECRFGDVIKFFWIKRNYLLSVLNAPEDRDVHFEVDALRRLPRIDYTNRIARTLQAAILEGFDIDVSPSIVTGKH